MKISRHRNAPSIFKALVLGALAIGARPADAADGATAATAKVPVITVQEPAGFDDLTGDQTMIVDVYFGGVRRGEAMVRVSPGELTFVNPDDVLRLLPPVTDAAAIRSRLAGQAVPANAGLACAQGSDRSVCGRLSPETVGIIFDRDRFRVDVFLTPRFLTVHTSVEQRYLPPPSGGLSAVNAIGALVSGQSGPGSDYYNLYDRVIVGDGERRLRAELSMASKQGFQADSIAFEWDRPELRFSAGELWARGSEISGRRKLIGGGIETQIDTRLDKDEIYGSPMVVYLDRRARVDVVRDGQVLSSAIYDAGNQRLDTANLPDGSYEIVLRVQEAGQPAHEERRFFTKSRRIPSLGRTDFFAFAGMLVKGRRPGSLDASRHPYAEGGVARRLSQHWAVEGMVQATDHGAAGEAGATWITHVAQARAALLAQTDGTFGEMFQVASSGNSRLNFNFDLRHVGSGRAKAAPALAPGGVFGSPYLDAAVGSYSQASGYLSYTVANLRLAATGIYRKDRRLRASYSVGPTIDWDVYRTGRVQVTLHGDFAATERGNAAFAGISLRLVGGKFSLNAQGGGRKSTIRGDDQGNGAVGSIGGTWTSTVGGGELALGAGYEHQPRQDDVILSSEYRHPLAQVDSDFVRSRQDGRPAVSQYSLGFQTTVTAGGGGVHVAGRTTTDSMIVARVAGAREGDRFELLVNDQVAGTILGTRTVSLALPDYRSYQVRIRPAGGPDAMAYDSSVRTVGLYPGVVTRLSWSASPITIKFGRLVNPDGTPIKGASITGRGAWSETDDEGYFQIEAPDNIPLTITTRDGRSYSITLPAASAGKDIARLGAVVCCGTEQVRLGALEQSHAKGSP